MLSTLPFLTIGAQSSVTAIATDAFLFCRGIEFEYPSRTVHSDQVTGNHHTDYDHVSIVKLLIPVSVLGWLLFGSICILCINGSGRAGRWIPEWYLDSDGSVKDKITVAMWWLAVMCLWPVILPLVLVSRLGGRTKMWICGRKKKNLFHNGPADMEEITG